MNITYKPYIRDSSFKELSIKSPTINIKGYKPKYTIKQDKEEAVIPVESPIEEIRVFKNSEINKSKADTKKFESKEDFKDTMIPIYESLLIKRGLNPVFAKALVAQDGLESAWGSKPSGNFNFGGIKGKGSNKRTREVINGKDVYINDSFRDFNSLEDYANFKIDLLNSNRYNAFSGNISEFADRVQKGGYATDPNYSRTLNKVIATAKHGGTHKLQLGGVVQGKQWVKNWYKNRTFQIKRNIQQHQLIPIPVTGALGYNILAHNIDLTTASIDPSKVPTDSKGVYSYRGRKIYLRDDSPSTAVHEWVHSSRPDPQVKEIARIKNLLGGAFYDQNSVIPDDYLDDPQEIYARLMQFRYALGVDSNHKFTNKEIEDLKKKHVKQITLTNRLKGKDHNSFSTTVFDNEGNVISAEPYQPEYKYIPEESTVHREYDTNNTFQFLDRYSTDSIRMMLNDVAQVPNKKKDSTLFAELGLKVPKYQNSGVLRNAYNDPEHYYDYSRGKRDNKQSHWSDRDPISGMELKNPKHPTAFMHYEIEQHLGNKRYQDDTGRYYTFPENEAPTWRNVYGVLSETPGLKEVGYPSYGEGQNNMQESIKGNLPRIKWIWEQFINAGATPEQAAAILGNFWKESRIQYNGSKSSKGAVGLAQLLGQRYNAYQEFLNNNKLIDSTEAQIKYLTPIIFGDDDNPHNLTGDYTYWINKNNPKHIAKYNSFLIDWNKSQRNRFRNAKGLDNITTAFADNFERMDKKEADYETRKAAARYIYNLMMNK